MAFRTPGVHIQEISTFPPSVVAVETAIPAFVGYTEKAEGVDGGDLNRIPTRIKSLLEFEDRFGGPFQPAAYRVQVDIAGENEVGTVVPLDGSDNERRFYLHDSVRQFYANGGGPCYIVSVGLYPTQPILGSPDSGLQGGLASLSSLDEPTMLVIPDGVSLGASDLGALQSAALGQCARLQDRFLITDLRQGYLAAGIGSDPIAAFRDEVGTNDLKYGAAYYPWVRTIYRPQVGFRRLNLVDNGDVALTQPEQDSLTGDAALDSLVPAVRDADAVVASIVSAVDVSSMVGDPIALSRDTFSGLQGHFDTLLGNLRAVTLPPIADVRTAFHNILRLPRAIALAFPVLADASLPAELDQAVANLSADAGLAADISALIAFEKNTHVLSSVSNTRDVAAVDGDYADLNATPWILPNANAGVILADAANFLGGDQRETALNAAAALEPLFSRLAAAILSVFEIAEFLASGAERRLFDQHPVYKAVLESVQREMTLLPVAGAIAGVYAATDRTRGVWKAPANVSLSQVSGPAVQISSEDQGGLNVHSSGKSVNAVRSFAGKGSLVWGARTLAGNDNEWRYVPVRRFFSMAEESIKKSTEPFVFEPNDANTWVRVRAMIENFLTVQWRQGALAGATAPEAFFVKVGLGETMTAQDILEGRMIIEVGMAVVRPAEFIILKFAHKMQVS